MSMPNNLTIALVQFAITHLNPEANIQRAEAFIRQAANGKADVIIFPEDFLTGSIFGDIKHLDKNKNFQNIFRQLAIKYKIDIVSGSWMEAMDNRAFSTTNYIDSAGQVLGEYHKNHLYLSERHFLSPGTEVSVFDTKYGKTGLIICWDIMYPEIFQRMNKLGVQIVYCPSYWYKEISGQGSKLNGQAEKQHLDALCLARAVENNLVFVYNNAAGTIKFQNGTSDELVGNSQIAMSILGTVARIDHNREEMLIKTIDLSILNLAEETYHLRADKNNN